MASFRPFPETSKVNFREHGSGTGTEASLEKRRAFLTPRLIIEVGASQLIQLKALPFLRNALQIQDPLTTSDNPQTVLNEFYRLR